MRITGLSRAMGLSMVRGKRSVTSPVEESQAAAMMGAESLKDVQLNPGASTHHERLKAMTEKAGNIQNMMQALQSIKDRVQGLRNYANDLSGTELTNEGSTELFAYMTEARQQVRAFVRMMLSHQQKERMESGQVLGLAKGFRAADVLSVDPREQDLTTKEGIEKFLESMRQRLELLSSCEGYLREQQQRLVSEMNEMEQDMISVMKADGQLNKALAMDLAGLASEQLLKGFDIMLGLDGDRQKSRIAKLLDMEVKQSYMIGST